MHSTQSSPVRAVTPGLWQVSVPVPVPLRFVNGYLLEGSDGYTLIDTGFHTPEAEASWHAALAALGLAPSAIRRIVVTHYHPDHYGLAGWLQQLTGARVFMTAGEYEGVRRLWRADSPAGEAMAVFFEQNGMPAEVAAGIAANQLDTVDLVSPQPPQIELWQANQEVDLGGRRFRCLETPGHTDHQLCLLGLDEPLFFSADQVLPHITPNISVWSHGHNQPLHRYLHSLGELAELPVELVLPGHGKPFANLGGRVREIAGHHQERLQEMLSVAAPGRDAWEVTLAVFGHRLTNVHQQRFAMAETLAHLEYLVTEGLLARTGGDRIRYHQP